MQSLLLRRPDFLALTERIIHLMPFFRFDPPPLKKMLLSTAAHLHKFTIPMMTTLVRCAAKLPQKWIDLYLEKVEELSCPKGRKIAIDVLMQPNMMRNHLVLGLQEIRGEES